ncbi:hypothetical protein [Candidatus Poriferisodalis sp.]|uniref:hypothetical protein n=1 Tax=Candidatus Poriferisodalis sp. TaxID=3101277 RepID=UPI003B0181EF
MTVPAHRARTGLVGSIAVVGLLAGVLSGCGASDDSADATPSDEAPAAAAAPATTAAAAASTDAGDDSGDGASQDTAAAPATTAASAAPAETRPEILLLDTQQLDGQQFDLAATAGNDVLLWFWAPW